MCIGVTQLLVYVDEPCTWSKLELEIGHDDSYGATALDASEPIRRVFSTTALWIETADEAYPRPSQTVLSLPRKRLLAELRR